MSLTQCLSSTASSGSPPRGRARLLRYLLHSFGCALVATSVQGAVVVSEDFGYPDGTVGGGDENGGTGWAGAWGASSSGNSPSNEFTIASGQAIFTGNGANQEIITHERGLASALTVEAPDTLTIDFDLIIGPTDGQAGRGIGLNFRNGGSTVFTLAKRINGGIAVWANGIGADSTLLSDGTIGQVAGTTYNLSATVTYNGVDTQLSLTDGSSTLSATLSGVQVTLDAIQLTGYHRSTTGNGVDNLSLDVTTVATNTPPSIAADPTNLEAVIGDPAVFQVSAEGGVPLVYQWRSGGTDLPGETNVTLTLSDAGCGPLGPFDVVVTNGFGAVTSQVATLTVVGPATLPAAQLVLTGNPAEFQLGVAPTAALSYQWRTNGVAVAGATGETYAIAAVTVADNGVYDAIVSCGGSTVTSESAQLIVPDPVTQPYATEVTTDSPLAYWRLGEGTGATVAVDEAGVGPYDGTYVSNIQWEVSGSLLGDTNTAVELAGTDGSRVEVPPHPTLSPNGPFSVELWAQVTGGAGTFRSPCTYRDQFEPQEISGWTFYAGANNQWQFWTGQGLVSDPLPNAWNFLEGPAVELGTWTHLVGTFDGTDLRFYVDGVLADELTNATYTAVDPSFGIPLWIGAGATERAIENPAGSDFFFPGRVDEVAFYGTALSPERIAVHYASAFPLTLPPAIDESPQDLSVMPGVEATFIVAASSSTPITYQWQFEGGDLLGETNQALVLPGVDLMDAGAYRVIVANTGGASTSEVATLTVVTNVAGRVLSVNLVGFSNPDERIATNGGIAGVSPYRTNGWNEIGYNTPDQPSPVGGLTDADGTLTPLTLTWDSKSSRRGNWSPLVDADHALFTGFFESRDQFNNGSPVTLTLSNIPPAYTSIGYDVFVYMAVPAGAQANRMNNNPEYFNGSVSDGRTTFYYHGFDHRTWTPGDFRQATETSAANPTPADANYAVFEGLSSPTLTLTVDAHPLLIEGPGTLCGFQIVPGRTAPKVPLGIQLQGGTVRLDWTGNGVLQQTTNLNQEAFWNDIPGASNPYDVTAPQPTESFRLRAP